MLGRLKRACPWAKLGFPGLALNNPHRDLAWLRIWQLEAALAVAESSLVAAHANIQSLQTMLTEYIVQFELLREMLP